MKPAQAGIEGDGDRGGRAGIRRHALLHGEGGVPRKEHGERRQDTGAGGEHSGNEGAPSKILESENGGRGNQAERGFRCFHESRKGRRLPMENSAADWRIEAECRPAKARNTISPAAMASIAFFVRDMNASKGMLSRPPVRRGCGRGRRLAMLRTRSRWRGRGRGRRAAWVRGPRRGRRGISRAGDPCAGWGARANPDARRGWRPHALRLRSGTGCPLA